MSFADWDQDGDPDLILSPAGERGLRVLRNGDGVPTVAWESGAWLYGPADPLTGDLDGDGDLDLLVDTVDHGFQVLLREGEIFVRGYGSAEGALGVGGAPRALGDWDGDGDLDLAVGSGWAASPERVYANDGLGGFSLAWSGDETSPRGGALAWGDLDGDGDEDLAVGSANDALRVYRSDGQGLELVWTDVAPDRVTDLRWADVDDDGDLDLLVAGRDVRLLTNTDGGLVETWSAGVFGYAERLQLIDLDADGDDDLFVQRYGADAKDLVFIDDGEPGFTLRWWSPPGIPGGRSHIGAWGGRGGLSMRTQRAAAASFVTPLVPASESPHFAPCSLEPVGAPPAADEPSPSPLDEVPARACGGGGTSLLPLVALLGLGRGPRRRGRRRRR